MSRIILLDTGPLGYIVHPNDTGELGLCKQWLEGLRAANITVKVPQIADYELRRELLLNQFAHSIATLNKLIRSTGGLVRISVQTMQKSAQLWAQSRREGKQTCNDKAIDGDMILCAQAFLLAKKGDTVEIATTNITHLEHYSTAKIWSDISV